MNSFTLCEKIIYVCFSTIIQLDIYLLHLHLYVLLYIWKRNMFYNFPLYYSSNFAFKNFKLFYKFLLIIIVLLDKYVILWFLKYYLYSEILIFLANNCSRILSSFLQFSWNKYGTHFDKMTIYPIQVSWYNNYYAKAVIIIFSTLKVPISSSFYASNSPSFSSSKSSLSSSSSSIFSLLNGFLLYFMNFFK